MREDVYDGPERRRYGNGHVNVVTTWVHVISTLGFPIVVCMILLGIFTGYIPSPMSSAATLIAKHVEGDGDRQRVLRTMCRHQARSLHQNEDECDR